MESIISNNPTPPTTPNIASPDLIDERLAGLAPQLLAYPKSKRMKLASFLSKNPDKAIKLFQKLLKTDSPDAAITYISQGNVPEDVRKWSSDMHVSAMMDPSFFMANAVTGPLVSPAVSGGKAVVEAAAKRIVPIITKDIPMMYGAEGINKSLSEKGHPWLGLAAELLSFGAGQAATDALVKKAGSKIALGRIAWKHGANALKNEGGKDIFSFGKLLRQVHKSLKTAKTIKNEMRDLEYFDKFLSNSEYLSHKYPEFKPFYERELKRLANRHEQAYEILHSGGKGIIDSEGVNVLNHLRPHEKDVLGRLLVITDRYPRFLKNGRLPKEQLEAWNVDKRVQEAYERVRNTLDSASDHLAIFLKETGEKMGLPQEEVKRLVRLVKEKRGYFPRIRNKAGYWVTIKTPTGQTVWREPATKWNIEMVKEAALQDAAKEAKQFRVRPENLEVQVEKSLEWPEGALFENVSKGNAGALINSLVEEGKVDPETAQLFIKRLRDMYLARGFGRHFLSRQKKWIGGFITEPGQAIEHYVTGLTGYTNKISAANDYAKMLSGLKGMHKPQLFVYTNDYVRRLLENPTNIDKAFGRLRGLTYAYYLAAKPAFAALNMTQSLITTEPYITALAKQLGVKGVRPTATVGAAMKDAFKFMMKKGGLDKGLEDAIVSASKRGVLTDAFVGEMLGRETGLKGVGQKALEIASLPISKSEELNRLTAFISGWKVARKAGVDPERAYDIASETARKTQFQYGSSNLPLWGSSKAGKVWLTLRQYSLHLINLWREMYSKKEYKALLKSLGWLGALGGIESYPLVKLAKKRLRTEFGIDIDKEMKKRDVPKGLIKIVERGMPAALGVDMGGNLQVDIPGAKISSYKDAVNEMLGPAGGMLLKPLQALSYSAHGNTERSAEILMPAAIRNPMKAHRMYSEGATTKQGLPVYTYSKGYPEQYKYTLMEAILRGAGFTPSSESQMWESSSAYRDMKEYADNARSRIYYLLRSGRYDEAVKEAEKYNEWAIKNSFNPITKKQLKTALRRGQSVDKTQYMYRAY